MSVTHRLPSGRAARVRHAVCRASLLLWLVIGLLSLGSMLSACGQKGDLYRPDPTPLQQQ